MAKGFKLSGDAQLRNTMQQIGNAYGGREMDIDIEAALEPLRRETERNAVPLRNFAGKHDPFFPQPSGAPKGGHLDEGVVSVKIRGTAKVRVWWVTFTRRARYLAHLVEFGTAPHFQPRFKGGFRHPGARAHPFFRPAYDSQQGNVLTILGQRAWLRISTAAFRSRKK
ncbi:hypothetical protein [Mesorhizobium sp. M1B.F.Ca.ET.045.04.1.1]|uniref:hypothetical protein n=1 Tax=Mesorhizobium sp. M1B.F.Ca.ET.045.04.1.1 TaxID=2493673 RepID=UPI000F74C931|nr:hypothetical protein [Mesorhizobium sp. M1B.F.Ca.ET.045.04.1.1]AZO29426.1 hypothetical protein EJ071_19875 [Mesorhizobium sp. M1B.F.Ca.ET.045.04.1.1]